MAIPKSRSRLAADGQTLMQSTFLGSSGFDTLEDVALDPDGNIYVTGIVPANGFNFPTTPGSFDTSLNGGRDIKY